MEKHYDRPIFWWSVKALVRVTLSDSFRSLAQLPIFTHYTTPNTKSRSFEVASLVTPSLAPIGWLQCGGTALMMLLRSLYARIVVVGVAVIRVARRASFCWGAFEGHGTALYSVSPRLSDVPQHNLLVVRPARQHFPRQARRCPNLLGVPGSSLHSSRYCAPRRRATWPTASC